MKSSSLYTKLINEGPMTAEELARGPSCEERKDGVRKFTLQGGKGSTMSGTGWTKHVYFIDGKHEPKNVIKKWVESNNMKGINKRSLHWRASQYGKDFKEASREVFGTVASHDTGGEYEPGGVCPLCEEEYPKSLPDHLPGCEKK